MSMQLSAQSRQLVILEEDNMRLRADGGRKQRAVDALHSQLAERDEALKSLGEELGSACYEAATRAELLQESLDKEQVERSELGSRLESLEQSVSAWSERVEKAQNEAASERAARQSAEAEARYLPSGEKDTDVTAAL